MGSKRMHSVGQSSLTCNDSGKSNAMIAATSVDQNYIGEIEGTSVIEHNPPMTELSFHKNIHQNNNDKTNHLCCKICDKHFCTTCQLDRHNFIHGKPFECCMCPYTFDKQQNLRSHIMRKHDVEKLFGDRQSGVSKAYTCNVCKRTFAWLGQLRLHITKDHNKLLLEKMNFNAINENTISEIQIDIRDVSTSAQPMKDTTCELTSVDDRTSKNSSLSDFKCPECEMTLKSVSSFNRHILTHKKHLLCQYCSQRFANEQFLFRHMSKTHGNNSGRMPNEHVDSPLVKVCPNSLREVVREHSNIVKDKNSGDRSVELEYSPAQLLAPLNSSRIAKDYIDKEFEVIHSNNVSTGHHVSKEHFADDNNAGHQITESVELLKIQCSSLKKIICSKCDAKFDELKYYKMHVKMHVLTREFQCKLCESQFFRETFLKRHMLKDHSVQTASNVDALPYLCSDCGKYFTKKSSLKHHKRSHLGKIEKRYVCNVCGTRLSTKSTLELHLRVHSGERPYNCEYCEKAFKQKNNLIDHTRRMHTSVRPFVCSVCGKAFVWSTHLRYHMSMHTGDNPYSCKVCEKTFSRPRTLKDHIRTHSEARCFACKVCGATFKLNETLRRHTRIHAKTRSYICTLCGKGTNTANNLKTHMRTHTHERPYKCTVCEMSFPHHGTWKKHLEGHQQ